MHSAKHSFRWAGAHRCVPHRSCSNICFLASVFGCNGLKMFEGDCTRPVCETALTRCCLIHHGITSPFTDFSREMIQTYCITYYVSMFTLYIYIYINIYVYICIYTHYTTMQCSTITIHYTALHYIHTCIYITHVCHLTTKPTVQRTIHDRLKNEDKRRQDKNTVHIKDQTSAAQPQHKFFRFYHFYGLYTYDVQTHWSWSQHILESLIDSSRVPIWPGSASGASISDETPHWAECGYVHGLFAMSLCPLLEKHGKLL